MLVSDRSPLSLLHVRVGGGIPNPLHVNVPCSLKLLTSTSGDIDTFAGSVREMLLKIREQYEKVN